MGKPLTRVEEVVGPLSTLVVGFTLGDLILVVREGQVDSSRVDVQAAPKHRAEAATEGRGGEGEPSPSNSQKQPNQAGPHPQPGDCRAFDVPPGPSSAPRRLPARLSSFGALPQSEISGVAFAGAWRTVLRLRPALGDSAGSAVASSAAHQVPAEMQRRLQTCRSVHRWTSRKSTRRLQVNQAHARQPLGSSTEPVGVARFGARWAPERSPSGVA